MLLFAIAAATLFSLQPIALRVAEPEPPAEEYDGPPYYILQWDVLTNGATLKGFDLYTNGVHWLQTNASAREIQIFWPLGRYITNDLRAYSPGYYWVTLASTNI